MMGHFSSAPYGGEDWSGKGRPTYYMNIDIDHVTDPDDCVILDTEELKAVIPGFDWEGGHSGRQLDDDSARTLRSLFEKAVKANKEWIWSPKEEPSY